MKKERLKKDKLRFIIVGLILLNCLTIAFFLAKGSLGNNETVATVGKEKITRQDWLNEMESRYGKEVLKELIDQKVIETAGKKYGVKISDKAVERELNMFKTMYGSSGGYQASDENKWRQQIRSSLMLEELLTRDAKISEKEIKSYYEENKSQFILSDSYHISQIFVKTKKEADQTIKELEQGSSFSVLAMERSLDEFTANFGGDAGYINEDNERYSKSFIEEVKNLKPGKWSKAIKMDDGYAIVILHEYVKGKEYSYKEVKDGIRRQIALEQMDSPVSARPLWNELDVEWFYGKTEAH
ncbi:peptidyl-prolyl cis-trans isomerase [Bacillus sp. DTU_2020_1000418_1_SI_GHA_SEK_038]|uniref:peptidyl-prolyl cis-trans isomerase n=1 Tax=Bacillus sp. DTU_2020_1000418_1_SI_GHA_SEK_038 TaxID=3077585 RepID=UPI0028E47001|nr:peptidyl-prolyl cis-trans isomerase [Bacillus sp. DTU_2020_1000418_1_SI_GHA_SEK_038]WNS75568.1 peptidyl-prolyl cis-trans isomerase [Bacillus sp. DTU_2020_1000418_1_SI_GHA_SEK_038]